MRRTLLALCAATLAACADTSTGTVSDAAPADVSTDARRDAPDDLTASTDAPFALDDAGTLPPLDDVTATADVGDDADVGPFEDIAVADVPPPPTGRLLPRCEETETAPITLAPVASTLVATVAPTAWRVGVANPFVNPSTESGERSYRNRNFDRYTAGPGESRVQRTDLGGSTRFGDRRSLAWFVHVSDYQLTDDESPARFAGVDTPGLLSSGLRPQEALLPRALVAMNRTIARTARPARPFQFGVFAGDCADTGQLNELQWFTQLMDGARGVHTDSGNDDDPVPGPDNDPKDPFDSLAFPAPWYFVPGNHDVLVVGIFLPTDARQAIATGNNSTTGTRDYARWYAPVRNGTVVPDARRRLASREDIVRTLRASPASPGPVGHGYPASTDLTLGAHWVGDVVPGVLRLVSLDTSDDTGGSTGLVHRATVDRFLRPELERARRDGVLVMVTSHHPIDDITRTRSKVGLPVSDAVDGDELGRIVAGYGNVIAWLVGHQHKVRVRALRGADATHPGFWEIQSGSIADWPSQSRAVEVVDNGNGTLSIFGTMLDFDATTCMERRYRRLALLDYLSGWAPELTGTRNDRNVELVIPVPAEATAMLTRARAAAPARIESETTLRGQR